MRLVRSHGWALAAGCAVSAGSIAQPNGVRIEEELHLIGGCVVDIGPIDRSQVLGTNPAPWATIVDNGPPENRVDLVFVGDGYLQTQLGAYATHVQNALDDLFTQEPFVRYEPYFNVHRVSVVSPQSGVDHDPTFPILRDTALDMYFFCGGTERLLCVSTIKALSYAANAPDVDQIFAVANSTKYGGAGYPSNDLSTYSGGNGSSPEIAIHELGHALGNLADEYWTTGVTYNGAERPEANASILTAAQMASMQTKWWRWLNEESASFDGIHSTYQGGYYSQFGVYRPTLNSKMRNLGRPFNLIALEALIANIYAEVDPIDDAAPNDEPVSSTTTLWVDPMDPVGQPLSVQWLLAGGPIPGATGLTYNPSSLPLSGSWTISVQVVDQTPWVRDPTIRAQRLTSTRSWTVLYPVPGDVNGDGMVNFADINIVLGQWLQTGPTLSADLNDDGIVNFEDLNIVLGHFNT